MGFESFNGKPPHIKDAMRDGDSESLSRAGTKGAEVANRNRDLNAAVNEAWEEKERERKAAEETALRESTNEHILTADGEDPNDTEETAD